MKIAVYGATGQIGSRIVSEAAQRGHEVTRLSRSGGDSVERVDAADVHAAAQIAREHDVVISAIGPSRADGGDPADFVGILERLGDSVGATRLVVVGGAGSLLAAAGQRLVDLPEFPETYRPEALAQADALDMLRASRADLDWTYLSPAPVIEPGTRTGAYLVGTDRPAGDLVSIEDFAVALVDELEQPRYRRARFTVANRAA